MHSERSLNTSTNGLIVPGMQPLQKQGEGTLIMSQTLTPEQERRILTFATHYAKNHWEVSQAAAHLSIDELGESDLEDEDIFFLCIDLPRVSTLFPYTTLFR